MLYQNHSASRLLLLSEDSLVLHAVKSVAVAARASVKAVQSFQALETSLRTSSYDLILIDLNRDAGELQAVFAYITREGTAGGNVLALGHSSSSEQLQSVMSSGCIYNFVGWNRDRGLNPIDLWTTVQHLLQAEVAPNVWLNAHLRNQNQILELQVSDSAERKRCLEDAEAFCSQLEVPSFASDCFVLALDELLSNALFDSPTTDGQHRFIHLPRSAQVRLEDHEKILVRLAFDGTRMGMSVCDPFGSLKPEVASVYLARSLVDTSFQPVAHKGGAGLGLFQVFRASQRFALVLHPGSFTEVNVVLEPLPSMKKFFAQPKSFHVFSRQVAAQKAGAIPSSPNQGVE